MFCKNCGSNIDDNAQFCKHCGTAAESKNQSNYGSFGVGKMSKKEYFASGYCSEKSKKLITANWIVFAVLAVILVFNAVTMAIGVPALMSLIDLDQGFMHFFEQIEDLNNESFDFDEEDIAILEDFEEIVGITAESFIETVIYAVVIVTVVMAVLVIIFSLVAVIKKSTGFAITALVLTALFISDWICIGITVAILVMTIFLNKEYKESMSFGPAAQSGNSEPDFSA